MDSATIFDSIIQLLQTQYGHCLVQISIPTVVGPTIPIWEYRETEYTYNVLFSTLIHSYRHGNLLPDELEGKYVVIATFKDEK